MQKKFESDLSKAFALIATISRAYDSNASYVHENHLSIHNFASITTRPN